MIFFRLKRAEAEKGDLPLVCVRCGAPSFVMRSKRLSAQPFGAFFLFCAWGPMLALLGGFVGLTTPPSGPVNDEALALLGTYVLVASVHVFLFGGWLLQRWATVRLPFCARHHLHWFKNAVIDLASIVFLASLLLFLLNFSGVLTASRHGALGVQRLFCSVFSLYLMAWVVWKAVSRFRAVQANDVTDRTVTLSGIHPAFREALLRWRHERRKTTRPVDEQAGMADDQDVAALWAAITQPERASQEGTPKPTPSPAPVV